MTTLRWFSSLLLKILFVFLASYASLAAANQPAVISGKDYGVVIEDKDPDGDNLLEVSRKLKIADPDPGESVFRARVYKGRYGSLRIKATGHWYYKARNNRAVIQALGKGDVLKDIFKVSSIDGTTRKVRIRIKGVNDAPAISGAATGSVTKDVDPNGDNLLEVSGKLSIKDRDSGESAFKPTTRNGTYGALTINRSGTWRYQANNQQPAIQALKSGSSLTDTIKVSSIDGTTRKVRIRIKGVNDTPAISGAATGSVTEDVDPDGDNLLEVSGKLTIVDPNSGDARFDNAIHLGSYGELTIDAAGNWHYAANNKLASIQNLNSGASITDKLTVSSTSGVTRDIVITISGVDEPTTTANVTISWIAPVEREDGTPISMSEIGGYKVYYGTAQNVYANQVEISGSANMQATLRNLAPGTYYIVITTYDTDGRESAYSTGRTWTL